MEAKVQDRVDPRFIPICVEIPFLKYEFFAPPFLKEIVNEIRQYIAIDVTTYKRSYTEISKDLHGNGHGRTLP